MSHLYTCAKIFCCKSATLFRLVWTTHCTANVPCSPAVHVVMFPFGWMDEMRYIHIVFQVYQISTLKWTFFRHCIRNIFLTLKLTCIMAVLSLVGGGCRVQSVNCCNTSPMTCWLFKSCPSYWCNLITWHRAFITGTGPHMVKYI